MLNLDQMPKPEEFGPNAVKVGDLIIPAKEIIYRFGNDDIKGEWEIMSWWTPIETHMVYKIMDFSWEHEHFDVPRSCVVIEYFGDYEDPEFSRKQEFDGKAYWLQCADLCTTEESLRITLKHMNRVKKFREF